MQALTSEIENKIDWNHHSAVTSGHAMTAIAISTVVFVLSLKDKKKIVLHSLNPI